ncbi:Microfibril-associated glycoprotein 4 36 kDa microfibril-associated glycoprotein [Larimichthys crocea]|uniref:Microfibril-associated glycoprotein 4 36 kDa microfibril-associated glycoprotein n=1 Tax=Larimichthys crocea TaxID=215358 RepID=A0A6G0HX37_LARCR|nr:Microfibril-associated glycoprotein 4 36 kDa microfibril-associated glycoprotein [Larimichthys crocea]
MKLELVQPLHFNLQDINTAHQRSRQADIRIFSRTLTMKVNNDNISSVPAALSRPPRPGSSVTSCTKIVLPVDCSDIYQQDKTRPSGVYTIYPIGSTSAVQVYCDMQSEGGQWTVFQRRMDGSVNFYRPWHQYKMGFGRAAGEYWLGLDNIHQLTHQRKSELLVDMEDFTGKKVFARYSSFSVESECDGYALHVSGFKNGGAGDSLTYHNKKKFSTFDKDQDTHSTDNCARNTWGDSGTNLVTSKPQRGLSLGG